MVIEVSDHAGDPWGAPANRRKVVAQATGVLMAQFGLNAADAFDELEATARAEGREITHVAAQIVAQCGP